MGVPKNGQNYMTLSQSHLGHFERFLIYLISSSFPLSLLQKGKQEAKKFHPGQEVETLEREDLVPFSQFCFKLCLLFLHLLLSQTSAGLRKLIVDYRDSILQKGNGLLPI